MTLLPGESRCGNAWRCSRGSASGKFNSSLLLPIHHLPQPTHYIHVLAFRCSIQQIRSCRIHANWTTCMHGRCARRVCRCNDVLGSSGRQDGWHGKRQLDSFLISALDYDHEASGMRRAVMAVAKGLLLRCFINLLRPSLLPLSPHNITSNRKALIHIPFALCTTRISSHPQQQCESIQPYHHRHRELSSPSTELNINSTSTNSYSINTR